MREIPFPKFSMYQVITATQERYGPTCPHVSRDGVIVGMRFILELSGRYHKHETAEWEYELEFPEFGSVIYIEDALVNGIKYSHYCKDHT